MDRGTKLKVRQRNHDFGDLDGLYWDSGNAVLTHEWNALSMVIPAGERFFIRSVKKFEARARDPKLRIQIKGFVGQELIHARETERSLEVYRGRQKIIDRFARQFERVIRFFERVTPDKLLLAATAGVEHYTAVFSIWHLRNNYAARFPRSFCDLIQWHGAEELEHKAVAFDLLQEVSPNNYLLRALGFLSGMAVVAIGMKVAQWRLLKGDGFRGVRLRRESKAAQKVRIPLLSLGFPLLFTYLRPGFHPNDLDDGDLGRKILARQEAKAPA